MSVIIVTDNQKAPTEAEASGITNRDSENRNIVRLGRQLVFLPNGEEVRYRKQDYGSHKNDCNDFDYWPHAQKFPMS